MSNPHVFETTFHTFGIFFHHVTTNDFALFAFKLIHQVVSSDVIILGTGIIKFGVFTNTQLNCPSILGVLTSLAAFVCDIVFKARSDSNKFNISKLFLFPVTEYIYSLFVNGSVGVSFKFLDNCEITEFQSVHCDHTKSHSYLISSILSGSGYLPASI
jgi:hypothetical protein